MKPCLAFVALMSALLLWDHLDEKGCYDPRANFRVYGRPSLTAEWQLLGDAGTNHVFYFDATNGMGFFRVASYYK